MVQDKPFCGKVDENPYFHLREFEQTCACLHIEGMSDETLRWKPFPFSLTGETKCLLTNHEQNTEDMMLTPTTDYHSEKGYLRSIVILQLYR
jgi:hypothetical protein